MYRGCECVACLCVTAGVIVRHLVVFFSTLGRSRLHSRETDVSGVLTLHLLDSGYQRGKTKENVKKASNRRTKFVIKSSVHHRDFLPLIHSAHPDSDFYSHLVT